MKLSFRTLAALLSLSGWSAFACTGEVLPTPATDAGEDVQVADSATDSSKPDASGDSATEAATDATTDATPPYDVKTTAGLVLWLDAAQGVTGTSAVSAWADQSGSNNSAAMATANYQPALVAASIGGKPAIHFTGGTHLAVADAVSLQWGTADFHVSIVLKHNTLSSTYGMVFSKQEAANPFPGPGIFANYPLPSQGTAIGGQVNYNTYISTATTGLNDNVGRQFSLTRTGGVISVRVNGTQTTGASSAINVDAVGRVLSLGANATGGQALSGDIAEVIAVKGAISVGTMASLEGYLKAKYSL